MMQDLKEAGIECDIIKEGEKAFKIVAGNVHKTYRFIISCNTYLKRLHDAEAKKPLLFR